MQINNIKKKNQHDRLRNTSLFPDSVVARVDEKNGFIILFSHTHTHTRRKCRPWVREISRVPYLYLKTQI